MTNSRLRVALIFGGRSVEHEVSVNSAQHVIAAADPSRFEIVPMGVTPDGVWLSPIETAAALAVPDAPFQKRMEREEGLVPSLRMAENDDERHSLGPALEALADVDVVFPLIHGTHGEDGTLQGMLELAALPYVGCGVAASALGMDKVLMKSIFNAAGIPVAEHVVVFASDDEASMLRDARAAEEKLGLPVFVKPANGGSSLGVSKATSREELIAGLTEAAKYDRKILIERIVVGREIECGILGNRDPLISGFGEIVHGHEFYDYDAKYLDAATQIVVPADVTDEVVERGRDLAMRAFKAIDGAGLSRVDFFLSEDGSMLIAEINTLPGFTPASMYPRLWAASGVSYGELIARLIDLAISRHRENAFA